MSTQDVIVVGISIAILVNIIGFGALYISKKQSKKKQ
jgi:uncharacterized protein YneF (UPF0154 family)